MTERDYTAVGKAFADAFAALRLVPELRAELARVEAERGTLTDVLTELVSEGCREELGAEANFNKCWQPAEFILWGKLIPPEGLGPRCYDHAAKHVGHPALAHNSGYALVDLRPARAALTALEGTKQGEAGP